MREALHLHVAPGEPALAKAVTAALSGFQACPVLIGAKPADVVVVGSAQALSAQQEAHPEAAFFVVLPELDSALLLECLRLGAREAMTLADLDKELPQALTRLLARRNRPTEVVPLGRSGKLHAFIGSKGGVGVTTMAVNVARELARQGGQAPHGGVVLVDMNLPYGEIPLFLGMTMRTGLSAVLNGTVCPEPEQLLPFLGRHPSGIAVLALPAQLDEGPADLSPDCLCGLLDELRSLFDHVVVDLGIYLDDLTLRVMAQSDAVYLVAVQNMACVRNIRRFLDYVRINPEAASKIRLLLNRHLKDCDLLAEDMEKALGLDCYWKIPNDYPHTLEAINQGIPVVDFAPKSPVSRELTRLVRALGGGGRSQGALSGLGRLLFGGPRPRK